MYATWHNFTLFLIVINPKIHGYKFETGSKHHIMVRGIEISKDDIYISKNIMAKCRCSQLCIEDGCCKSYSVKPQVDYGFSCHLSEKLPKDCLLINSTADSFVSVPIGGVLEEDSRVYWISDGDKTFHEALKTCSSRSHFKMGIFKTTDQLNVLKKYHHQLRRHIWVDLTDNGSNDASWGDGTLFSKTDLASQNILFQNDETHNFMIWDGSRFDDVPPGYQFPAICFMNPSELFR